MSRRRIQTLVVALATLMAVASAVVAGSLIVASAAPFDTAFARQHGPHLTAQIDAGKANPATTAHVSGVTASAGPYPIAVISPKAGDGFPLPDLTVAGRPSPGGALDDLTMTAGRWPNRPGEIALASTLPPQAAELGSALTLPDGRRLTVVGQARSVTGTADAWVTPGEIAGLRAPGRPAVAQMLYRFSGATTRSALAADRARLAAALPEGALLGTQTYLDAKYGADRESATFVPFLLAFGALGLVMSVIIVASVVGGAVATNVRRIGVLKALGFTPAEVVRAHIAQALVPATAGTLLGVALGNALAYPLLGDVRDVYGSTGLTVAWWVDLAVAAAALGVVVVAALVPALRAGRLRTVEAIAVGRAPGTGRGRWAQRITARLPLPRTVSLGLANPFARPVRTAAMLAAVVFGTAAATFAVGLAASLNVVGRDHAPDAASAVLVLTRAPGPDGPPPRLSPNADARLRAAIRAQPGTASFYGTTFAQVTLPGVVGSIETHLYQGDLKAASLDMIAGHWITGPGQAVVPTHFLEVTGHRIGDTITVLDRGVPVRLRITGEAFDLQNDGMRIHADIASFASVKGATAVETYSVGLKRGVPAGSYLAGLNTAIRPLGAQAVPNDREASSTIVILDSMAALLTLMLVTVAGLGVLNSVVLDTRERVHDLGVCKAIGMSPRQTVTMVLASVTGIGAVGGIVGLPAGVALHDLVLPLMGHGAGTGLTPAMMSVYHAPNLVPLALGGIVIAVLGALLPAGWAARARTATALRTE